MQFLCSSCGACCRLAGLLADKYNLPLKKDRMTCAHLVDSRCSIYNNRPDCCRVDKAANDFIKENPNITKKEYYIETTELCHKFIDNEGLNDKYKINIKEYNTNTNKDG
jgi:hypothetical protein